MPPRRGTMPSWSWTIRPSRSWRASPGRGSRTGSRMRPRSGGSSSQTNRGGGTFVIDAATNSVVARIELGGEAGNTQYDAGSHCVIVAVQTANRLAVIDPATPTIVRPITFDNPGRYPHGFYVDAPHPLAFISRQGSGTLGLLDLRTP